VHIRNTVTVCIYCASCFYGVIYAVTIGIDSTCDINVIQIINAVAV